MEGKQKKQQHLENPVFDRDQIRVYSSSTSSRGEERSSSDDGSDETEATMATIETITGTTITTTTTGTTVTDASRATGMVERNGMENERLRIYSGSVSLLNGRPEGRGLGGGSSGGGSSRGGSSSDEARSDEGSDETGETETTETAAKPPAEPVAMMVSAVCGAADSPPPLLVSQNTTTSNTSTAHNNEDAVPAVSTGSSGNGSSGGGSSGGRSPSENSDEAETAAAATDSGTVRAKVRVKRKTLDSSGRRGRIRVYSSPPSSGSSGCFPHNSSDSDEMDTTTNGTTTVPATRGSSDSSPPLTSQNLTVAHNDDTTTPATASTGSLADFPQNSSDSDETEAAKGAKKATSRGASVCSPSSAAQHLTTVRMQVHNEETIDRTLPAPDPMSMWLRSNRMTSDHERPFFQQQMPLPQNPALRRQIPELPPPPQQRQQQQQRREQGSNQSSSSSSDMEMAGLAELVNSLATAVWGMQEKLSSERHRVDGVIEALIMLQDRLLAQRQPPAAAAATGEIPGPLASEQRANAGSGARDVEARENGENGSRGGGSASGKRRKRE